MFLYLVPSPGGLNIEQAENLGDHVGLHVSGGDLGFSGNLCHYFATMEVVSSFTKVSMQ